MKSWEDRVADTIIVGVLVITFMLGFVAGAIVALAS